uniref:Cysteine--tRNA ligase, cytoplasmic n=1 Tax=Caenorhabditis tropicalis TaxID=1561998 RepID=A0A1I7TKL3_9PELO
MDDFGKLKFDVHAALCDSVDTRTVIEKFRELIALGNAYINETDSEKTKPNCLLLRNIAAYITNLLKIFGAIPQSSQEIGFVSEDDCNGTSFNKEDIVMPYLDALAKFRENIRSIAKEHKVNAILEECDILRDKTLTNLGVRLEDKNGHTTVKLGDRASLMREQEQKEAEKKRKEKEKLDKELKAREKSEKEAASIKIKPEEFFKQGENSGKFSQYDARGVPTHMADGTEVTKSQLKKLEKAYEAQKKKYQE